MNNSMGLEPRSGASGAWTPLLRLAAGLCRTTVAVLAGPGLRETWCSGTAHDGDVLQALAAAAGRATIPDAAQHPRLLHNPAVAGPPGVRFVASVPVAAGPREAPGTLWVMDPRPRPGLAAADAAALADLAALAARALAAPPDVHATRLEQAEALVARAPSCERALAALLVALCRHHGAATGFVGKLPATSRVMQLVATYPGTPDPVAEAAPLTPETSPAAAAIQSGTARTVTLNGAELIQPVYLLNERFGLVLRFDALRRDLPAVADDVAALVRAVRPMLVRRAADRRMHLLGSALDHANDPVVICEAGPPGEDGGPRIVHANAAFCRTSLYAADEVLGQPFDLLHGPDTDPATARRLRQEMRRGRPVRAELRQRRKDGTSFWAELDVAPIAGEGGHFVCIARDVTGRRDVEALQRQHETSFRMAFRDNPLAVAVVGRADLAFLDVNDAAVAQYGWSRTEFLARHLPDLSPDGRASLIDDPAARGPDGASVTHVRDDGSRLDVQAFVRDTIFAGQDAAVTVLRAVAGAARRGAEGTDEMLRERTLQMHARTAELAEAQRLARLATWHVAVDRRGLGSLDALAALPRDDGKDEGAPYIHPEDQDPVRGVLQAAVQDGASRSFEYRVRLPGDQVRHVRAEVRPVPGADGTVVELFGCSQDVSDARRAEQALRRNESLRALGQLTGGVAHDFNNLLTVVILNLEEAQDVLGASHALQDVLAPALHAAVRGAQLTGQLLSYARRATLRPERVRPDQFFAALRPLLDRVLGERHQLEVLLRHNGGSAMVDPAQLDSAVMNLVINARDALPAGGTIVLETRSATLAADTPGFADEVVPGRYVVISVADKGAGIPAHVLPRVFEPFFTTKEAGRGSGMGLSTVYGFARQSGGHVTVDSAPGQGTTVRLFLPVAAGPDEDGDTVETPAAWSAQGLRALIVEDQDSVLRTTMRMLRQFGFAVTGAATAAAALDRLEQDAPFDLLFTDIVLPGPTDGVALAEEVRLRCPDIHILLTSGYTEHSLGHSLAARDVAGPGMAFLMKPYKRGELQAKFAAMFPAVSLGLSA